MKYTKINVGFLEQAIELVMMEYNKQSKTISSLPNKDYRENLERMLSWIFKKDLGIMASEDGILKGFITFIGIDELFGNIKGAFAPMGASYFGDKNRRKMARELFKRASKALLKEEILSYGIGIYAEDLEILKEFSMNGFGYRCSDGVRKLQDVLDIEVNDDFKYEEISWERASVVLPLHNKLQLHMTESPIYFKHDEISEEEWKIECAQDKNRFFIARDTEKIIGYLSVGKGGETFITGDKEYMHINGAFLESEYRGKNIMQSLLKNICGTLKDEGIIYLGVDCETINPNAIAFWEKYFQSYNYSLTRRIDERIL